MLLQTKYSLWKKFTILLGILLIILFLGAIVLKVKNSFLQKDLTKTQFEIQKEQDKISFLKNDGIYKKILLADEIIKNEKNSVNYVALYEYLLKIKKLITQSINAYSLNEMKLSIKPGQVLISTDVKNYAVLYSTGGLYEQLKKFNFIKSIESNSFKSVNNSLYINLKLNTK